jgi:hypothetical protein
LDLEEQIWVPQKELAKVQNEQALLRYQPCRGDSEISGKDDNLEELDNRAKVLKVTLRDLTGNRQLMISGSTPKGIYDGNSQRGGPEGSKSEHLHLVLD